MGLSALCRAMVALLAAIAFAGLAACSEKPQRMVSEGQGSYNFEKGSVLAERTQNQDEYQRIAY